MEIFEYKMVRVFYAGEFEDTLTRLSSKGYKVISANITDTVFMALLERQIIQT